MTPEPSAASYLKAAAAALRRGSGSDAVRYIRPALIVDPGYADATVLAALGFRASGDRPAAIRCFRRALALRPGDAHARDGLASLVPAAGAAVGHVEHRALLDRALRHPAQPANWLTLGWSALEAGQRSVAWPALRRAGILAPGDRSTLPLLILAERRGAARVDWSALAARALVVDPCGAATLEAALVAYREARDGAAITRVCKRLMVSAPNAPMAYQAAVAVADVALRSRNAGKAERMVRRAEVLGPRLIEHASLRARLLRSAGRRTAAIAYLRPLIRDSADNPDIVGPMFDLASLLDEELDAAGAVQVLTAANRLAAARAAAQGADRRRFLAVLDRLAVGTRHPVDPATAALSEPAPVFLFGIPRSGTTLMGDLLHRHPRIETFDELDPLPDLVAAENARRRQAGDPGGLAELLARSQAFDPAEAAAMRTAFHRLLKRHERHPDKPVKVDKSPFGLMYVGLVARLFPRARIVFAIRHPADVCLSCLMQEFAPTDALASFTSVPETGELYARVMAFWTRVSADLPLPVHTVRYEELVADPERELKRLVGFLGLEWDPGMLDPGRTVGRYTATPSYRQVARAINRDSVARWTRYCDYLAPAWPHIEPWVRRLGYDAG